MRDVVALVSMPWAFLEFPSISLGILSRVLGDAGIAPLVFSHNLTFMDFVCRGGATVTLDDYQAIAQISPSCGLGDWIFAQPPFRASSAADDRAYLELVRHKLPGSPQLVEQAERLRAQVPAFITRCVDELARQRPALVGFTSTFNQNVASLLLSRCLKERDPSTVIVFGGANCDGPMGTALFDAFPWVDVVVQGEAEPIVVGLVREVLAGGPIARAPGLLIREQLAGDAAGRVYSIGKSPSGAPAPPRMNDIPTPRYDFYFETLDGCSFREDLLPRVRLLVETARGCWWGEKQHCTFCGLNGSSMAFRSKSIEHALADFVDLATRYKCLDFSAVDNIIELQYLRDLLPRLRASGLDLQIFYETKSNLVREQVRDLKRAGIHHIQPGIESLSTPILKLMRKGVTAWQNVQLLKWCATFGVRVDWNLLYGFPNEPPEEYARMSAAIPALFHLPPPHLNRLQVQRFSPYHTRAAELGVRLEGPRAHYRFVYPLAGPPLESLAYDFEYSHLDNRDPEGYIGELRQAVAAWEAAYERSRGALVYRVGPTFIRIVDSREQYVSYVLEDEQAIAYLACDAGATPAMVHRALTAAGHTSLGVDEVEDFLVELVAARLMFAADGRFVALALPAAAEADPAAVISLLARRRDGQLPLSAVGAQHE